MEFKEDKGTGYMYCYAPSHPCANGAGKVLEHVYVMWLHTGVISNSELHVHHKDRDRRNNRIGNLQMLSSADHAALHAVEDAVGELEDLSCKHCGRAFSGNTIRKRVFCSDQCSQLFRRRFSITKEELEILVWRLPTSDIATIYGVSDNAVAKRCKSLNIEKPKRGYWAKIRARVPTE